MAFRFKRKEAVSKGVRRIVDERIERARECLRKRDHVAAVHGARKEIKKTRAALRLVRTHLTKKKLRRIRARLRDAAHQLAGPRDAFVKTNTVDKLSHQFKGELAPHALRHLRAELQKQLDEEVKRFESEERVRTVAAALRRVRKVTQRFRLRGEGWALIGPGVKATYRQGQAAFRTARKHPTAENHHAWRKHAKGLWYQVRLLQRIWPEQMDAMSRELHDLTELLGNDHDLFVLQEELAGRVYRAERFAREVETLSGFIDQHRRELRASAHALGGRLYAEKPGAFCHRLEGYWQTWRGERPSGTQLSITADGNGTRLPADRSHRRRRTTVM